MPVRLSVFVLAAAAAVSLAPPPARASASSVNVVVKASGNALRRVHALERRASMQELGAVAELGLRVVRVPGDAAAAARRLAAVKGVDWAEPDVVVHAATAAVPNDPLFGATSLASLGAPAAWDALGLGALPGHGGVRVGIVDTGVDASHEDLRDRVAGCASAANGVVVEGGCGDVSGHGTAVAGAIAATAGNGVGLVGLAFSSPLVVCRALGPDGTGTGADVAACLRWTHDRKAKVVVLALAGADSKAIAEAVRYAWAGGHRGGSVVVAAAGTGGGTAVQFPAGLPEAVSVGAVDRAGAPTAFSPRNADLELTAPGVDVITTRAGGGYVAASGTSMAAALAGGATALEWDAHRRSAASTIRRRLDASVLDLGAPGRDPVFGFGRLDLTGLAAAR